jgi:hypothetical protein
MTQSQIGVDASYLAPVFLTIIALKLKVSQESLLKDIKSTIISSCQCEKCKFVFKDLSIHRQNQENEIFILLRGPKIFSASALGFLTFFINFYIHQKFNIRKKHHYYALFNGLD